MWARIEHETMLTADDMLTLPDDGRLHELVRGQHFVNPPPGGRHGQVVAALTILLGVHLRGKGLGVICGGDTGFILARNPDTVRGSDVCFVRADRISDGVMPIGYLEGAPDFAAEIISPSETRREIETKAREYVAAGALVVWVVDPRRRIVDVHMPNKPVQRFAENDLLDANAAVPGFTCTVKEILDWPC